MEFGRHTKIRHRVEMNEGWPEQALLKNDLETEKATMMLADIMFRSNEFDEAIRYCAQGHLTLALAIFVAGPPLPHPVSDPEHAPG